MAAKTLATSKDVRKFFTENPKMIPTGAEKSVQVSCKGRIKPTAIEVFNKKSGMHYDEGVKRVTTLTYKAKNHRMVSLTLPTAEVRRLAGKPGSKGPLSKADKDFAVQMYLSSQS